MMKRKSNLLFYIFLVFLVFFISPRRINTRDLEKQSSNRSNIILIIIDSLRADHLGCYGYHKQTSPNIDKMAERGVVFTNAISQA